jgi:hypothetical protein
MTSTNWSTSLVTQGTGAAKGAGNATTAPATTQRSSATTGQNPEAAARTQTLGDVINARVQRELNAADIKGAIADGIAGGLQGGQATSPTPPTPPESPGSFTIQGPNGNRTITFSPHAFDNTIPPQVEDISIMFFLTIGAIIIFLPLVRAFARRMDRRGGTAQIPNEVSSQLAHLNQAVDAIALEVERISEGQRFTTRLLSEQRDAARQTLGSGLK